VPHEAVDLDFGGLGGGGRDDAAEQLEPHGGWRYAVHAATSVRPKAAAKVLMAPQAGTLHEEKKLACCSLSPAGSG